MSAQYTRAGAEDSTTDVPLLRETDDSDLFLPFEHQPTPAEDNDSLEGHVTAVRQPRRVGIYPAIFSSKKSALVVVGLATFLALFISCIVLGVLLNKERAKNATTDKGEPGSNAVKPGSKTGKKFCLSKGCIDAVHYMVHAMNDSAQPCEDFFQFACGGWVKKNPIPSSRPFWGVYSILSQENNRKMRNIINSLTTKDSKSSAVKKAKAYYEVCMKEEEVDELGPRPLLDLIKEIGGWNISNSEKSSGKTFPELLRHIQANQGIPVFFQTYVDVDDKNSSRNIIKIDQGGLAIPRTNYVKNNVKRNETDKRLVAYLEYMTTVGTLLGFDQAATRSGMREVMRLEMDMAEIFDPPENRSQVDKMYNKMTIADLTNLCPSIPWLDVFQGMFPGIKIADSEEVVVFAIQYLKRLNNVVKKANASKTLTANYMMWQVVHRAVPLLSADFRRARLNLERVVSGTSAAEERWKTCMRSTGGALGMALGSLFVADSFQESSKKAATEMIDAIRTAFKRNLPNLKWMDEKTRKAAEDKADAVVDMIGFPPYILDPQKLHEKYEDLTLAEQFFQNARSAAKFRHRQTLMELRKPVNHQRWYMTPQMVNAYYSPSRNQIVFPAGILQAPYYDKSWPQAVNYGSIGAVVGHELTHGFDNSGRTYDKHGNLGVQWWTSQSVAAFEKQTQCMVEQYSKFSYFGKHVNGKYTLGENIADNGGLKAAYMAYKNFVAEHGEEPPLPLLNQTNDQIFFLSFGQSWCASITEAMAKIRLEDDSHSPDKFRVLGTLANSWEFAKAFKCPVGSAMNPNKKCQIW